MRALYQRKKGRDLYDLWIALQSGKADTNRVVECFQGYMDHDGTSVSRAEFEKNLTAKLNSDAFLEDIRPLIPPEIVYDPLLAGKIVLDDLIAQLPGESWNGSVA